MTQGGYADALHQTWSGPSGIRGFLTAVTHKQIGLRYIVTALIFFLIAGADSLVLRSQLTTPNSDIVTPQTFNQLFTTHGTAMMFLFAVPMLEGIGSYFVPLMLGARDMPYPRLNAFGYWTYLFGGIFLYASTSPDIINFLLPADPLPRQVPNAGWFAYPPLTLKEFSPDNGMDFWLLGVTLAEISAIVFAIETIAAVLLTRAPGMSLPRIPVFVWAVLVMSVMILFAFPSVIVASLFLETERQIELPFYNPALGGDPLLWQHLFWIFGHPEVYIQFIPATGIVSMTIPVFAGRPLIAYTFVVAAVLATGLLSFGLWVHHMFAVGIPWFALSFFGIASMMITIPSGVQIFAWLSTMLAAVSIRLTTSMLFSVGFIITFVVGGITGVMVASVPFDLQVHDTYFVVAHFHYVLIGGVVFPIFAGIHYWMPKVSGKVLDENLGKWTFWLWFIGFNVAFLPQHTLGLMGMPRRAFTYTDITSFTVQNAVSTGGAFLMAAGTLVFLVNMARTVIRGERADENPWGGGSLEWAAPSPPPPYNFLYQREVSSRDPMWEADSMASRESTDDDAGSQRLWREMLATSPLDAEPIAAILLPGNSYLPLVLALALAFAFAGVLFSVYPVVVLGVIAAVVLGVVWAIPDEEQRQIARSGRSLPGYSLPVHVSGMRSSAWWGMLLSLVALSAVAANFVFAYFYLAYGADAWPPDGIASPGLWLPALATGVLLAGTVSMHLASSASARGHERATRLSLTAASVLGAGFWVIALAWFIRTLDDPTGSAYAGIVTAIGVLQLTFGLAALLINGLVQVEAWRFGYTTSRRVGLQNGAMFWYFLLIVWLVTAMTVGLVPRLI